LFGVKSNSKHFKDKCVNAAAPFGKSLSVFYLYESLVGLAVLLTIMHLYPTFRANGNNALEVYPQAFITDIYADPFE